MRKQKHWNSEQEIIAAIDECHARATTLHQAGDELELQAKESIRRAEIMDGLAGYYLAAKELEWGNSEGNRFRASDNLSKASKAHKSAANLIDKKAKKLGAVLAAFRTEPMVPIVGEDRSVVAP